MSKSGQSGLYSLLFAVVVIATATAGYFWLNRPAPPPSFTTANVTRGDVLQTITASGELRPVVQVDVSSQVSGIIDDVMVDFNSSVTAGQVIAQLDPATYQSRLRQAHAQLANTRANYQLVKLNHDRVASLFERTLVSQQELDQVRAQLQQAEAQLLIQQAAVDTAEVDLTRCTITAPIDGIVISRIAEKGMTVAASLNAPTLFTIANDLTRMQIVAAVAEADVGNIALDQPVNFTVDAFPNRQFRGRVAQIRNAPVVVQSVVSYNTLIDVNNDDQRLRPGMTANVAIVLAQRQQTLRVPNGALRARIPEELLPPPPAATTTDASATAALRPATREQAFAIMQEAGFTPGAGRPGPEIMARAREIAASRGLELPQGRGGNASAASSSATHPEVTRTLYRLVGDGPAARLEAVNVRLGITDGATTEVIAGLAEGDRVVTGLAVDGATGPAARSANPFGGGRRF